MHPYPLTFNLDGEEFREGYDSPNAESAIQLARVRFEVHVDARKPKAAYVTVWNDPDATEALGVWDYNIERAIPPFLWVPEAE